MWTRNNAIKCDRCGLFCRPYDDYAPFGGIGPEGLDPPEDEHVCKKCWPKFKQEWRAGFQRGSHFGDWHKSRAEVEAAREEGLEWVHSSGFVDSRTGKHALYNYIKSSEKEFYVPYLQWMREHREALPNPTSSGNTTAPMPNLPLTKSTCDKHFYCWAGEYDTNCELPAGHKGHHYDGISWIDDDDNFVEPPQSRCGTNGGRAVGAGHECICNMSVGHGCKHGCECGALWSSEDSDAPDAPSDIDEILDDLEFFDHDSEVEHAYFEQTKSRIEQLISQREQLAYDKGYEVQLRKDNDFIKMVKREAIVEELERLKFDHPCRRLGCTTDHVVKYSAIQERIKELSE